MPLTYDELHQLLLEQEEKLGGRLDIIKSQVREDGVGYSNHMADAGTEVFEQTRDVVMRKQVQRSLKDARQALTKFADGTYGICESCGGRIDIPRLEAVPATHYCLRCKTRLEAKS